MSPNRGTLVVVAVAVLAAAALAAPAAGTAQEGPGAGDRLAQQVDADSVRMTVALQPDGDARWTVSYRVELETDNETAAFESLKEDVESNPENFTTRFGDRMRATAGTAENATGREMAVRNVTVDARTQSVPSFGILEYTFEWTNFAVVDGDRLLAGDAIAGLFLDSSTTLVVRWPEGYGLVEADPEPTAGVGGDRSVGWAGAVEFRRDQPRVVASESAGTPTGGGGGTDGTTDGGGGDGPDGGLPLGTLAGGLLLVAALAAGALYYRGRAGGAASGAGVGGDGGAGGDGTGGDGGATAGTGTAGAAAGGGAGDAAADDGGAAAGEPPEELLSNEEKVLKLVRERGGRVKQQEIVEAFDWTEAKTSQVVRDLRDDGDLEGFRLGRENVLRLPEEEAGGDDEG